MITTMQPRYRGIAIYLLQSHFSCCYSGGVVDTKEAASRVPGKVTSLLTALFLTTSDSCRTKSIAAPDSVRQDRPKPAMPSHALFSGFSSPNYTMVPDQLFDELLVDLSGAELKVLLYIIRRTYGFKRNSDAISLSQMLTGIRTKDGKILDRGVGLSKPTLLGALRGLIEQGIITAERRRSSERGDEATVYSLVFADRQPTTPPPPTPRPTPPTPTNNAQVGEGGKKTLPGGVVKKVDQGVVKKFNPQYTVRQKTETSNIRNKEENNKKSELPLDEQVYQETTIVLDELSEHDSALDTSAYRNHNKPTRSISSLRHTPQTTHQAGLAQIKARERSVDHDPNGTLRDALLGPIAQFAEEFDDQASLKSSLSRAEHLLRRSGKRVEAFVNLMWEARAITKERIRETSTRGPIASKMGYFFSVLTERLGLKEYES